MYDPFLVQAAFSINAWTSTQHFTIYAAFLVLVLLILRQYRNAAVCTLVFLVTSLVVGALKDMFEVPRPYGALFKVTSYAFPSGHAALSVAAALVGTWLIDQYRSLSLRTRNVLVLVFWFVAFMVSYSRVVLGVHTWAQVFGGAAVGIFVPFFMMRLVHHMQKNCE